MENGDGKQSNVKLIVNDEQSLYMDFSPEDEFNESVKSYSRSKLSDGMHNRQGIDMTVISKEPLNEERFRSAVSNRIKEEKVSFKRREKETLITLIGGLLFGSILLTIRIERWFFKEIEENSVITFEYAQEESFPPDKKPV